MPCFLYVTKIGTTAAAILQKYRRQKRKYFRNKSSLSMPKEMSVLAKERKANKFYRRKFKITISNLDDLT